MISVDLYLLWERFKRASLWSSKGFTVLIALIFVICVVFKVIQFPFSFKIILIHINWIRVFEGLLYSNQVLFFSMRMAISKGMESFVCLFSSFQVRFISFLVLTGIHRIGGYYWNRVKNTERQVFPFLSRTTWIVKTASLDFLGLHSFPYSLWIVFDQERLLNSGSSKEGSRHW